jgi:hypothetical protein
VLSALRQVVRLPHWQLARDWLSMVVMAGGVHAAQTWSVVIVPIVAT